MLKRDSPLLIQPRLSRTFLRWSWDFWRACSPSRYQAGLAATVTFLRPTFSLFDRMREAGVAFEIHRTGMVVAALSEEGLSEYVDMIQAARRAGYEGPVDVLDAAALRSREPSLSDRVIGGLYVADESYVRPEELSRGLVEYLRARDVDIREGSEVRNLRRANGRWLVETAGEAVHADRVVVAAGAWSPLLLSRLGIRLSFEAAKGYSVTAVGSGTVPRHALYLAEAKVGGSPFGEHVRFAGSFDLTGVDSSLRRRRIGSIIRSAVPYLRDWRPEATELEWAGLRPYPADNLPLLGPAPGLDGLFVATGHGRMGITMAPATGEAVREMVLENRVAPEIRPFAVERLVR
jgi:D-amino-acid dehydrogenase